MVKLTVALTAFSKLIVTVGIASYCKIAVVLSVLTKVNASKSISAPVETILKCIVPHGATIMLIGTNEAKSTLNSPVTRSIALVNGAYKVVPNFPLMLNSKICNNSNSHSTRYADHTNSLGPLGLSYINNK